MQYRKPAWWQLYALVPLMVGLLLAEHWDPFPGISPEIVDLGVVALTFSAMLFWMRLNSGLIEYDEMRRDKTFHSLRITIYDPQTDSSQDAEKFRRWSPVRLPDPADSISASRQGEREDMEKWSHN